MTRRLIAWFLTIQSLLLLAVAAEARPPRALEATVERVADGDTLVAASDNETKLRLRLLGIDAPEIAHGKKAGQPYGEEARQYLERLVGKRSVRVETFGPDIYRRLLAVVWVGETNVNVEMVQVGLAEVYRSARCQAYCRELREAEARAQRARAGIWAQERYESPAAFRKRARTAS